MLNPMDKEIEKTKISHSCYVHGNIVVVKVVTTSTGVNLGKGGTGPLQLVIAP